MRLTAVAALAGAALLFGASTALAQGVVTIYSADGLHDGKPNWYQTEFDAFTKATGIRVQYVEAGSGVMVDRVLQQRANQQADVLVTLPPFIQQAASDGLLAAYVPPEADKVEASGTDPQHRYYPMIDDYINFIYDTKVLHSAPKDFEALLSAKFKNKIQYSTPGQAGDGTAVMIQAFHVFGGKDGGFAYLKKLQANNVGPSSSTGRLTGLVNKGELWVANGDIQMNFAQMHQNPNIRIFWPAGPDGVRSTFADGYVIGLVKGAPHEANGKKLIDFLLSRQAQEQVSSIAEGFPVRTDVHPTDANFKALQAMMQGVKIWTPDWNAVLASLKSDVARWHKETGS